MSFSSAKRRRIKPYARPTAFDINVTFDLRHFQRIKYGNVINPYFPAVGTDEAFQVMEGEILMQNVASGTRRYGDHQCHVYSFANGLKGDAQTLQAGVGGFGEKAKVMKGLRYAGVAVTEFTPEKDIYEQGFVMTMGGLNTLFNNGSETIYPGDVICADIPNPADARSRKNRALQTGVPHGKLQFVVATLNTLSSEIGVPEAARFIMGTAMSYSRPGAPVDVVLHRCNMMVNGGGAADEEEQGDGAGGARGAGQKNQFTSAEGAKSKKSKKKK